MTVTIQCPHILSDGSPCEADLEIECDVEGGSMEGQDADGNRGMWEPASLRPNLPPEGCPTCACIYTAEETKIMEDQLEQLAADWTYEPDDPADFNDF